MNGVIVAEPIVIADENSQLLSITSTGSAKVVLTSSGVVPASQNGIWNITNITGTVSLPTGAATSTGQATTNSKLDILITSTGTVNTNLTNINSSITSTNVKLDTVNSNLTAIDSNIDSTNLKLDELNSSTGLVNENLVSIDSSIGSTNIKLDILNSSSGLVNTNLTSINASLEDSQGSVTPGTVALKSTLIGGQYNSTLPTMAASQQAALQIDYRGRLILSSTGATSVNQGIAAVTSGAWPIKVTDGTTVVAVTTNSEIRSSDTVNNGGTQGAITVGTSAVEAKVGASSLTNRKLLTIFHNGNGKLYWGYTNGVTTANGTQIFKNTMLALPVGDGTSVWLISDTTGQDIRITEGA